jgi:flavodoxin
MRILVVYYSKTGNTEAISCALKKSLEPNCEVDLLKIGTVKEYSNFMPHLNPRIIIDIFLNRKPRIKHAIDLSPYDIIFFNSSSIACMNIVRFCVV